MLSFDQRKKNNIVNYCAFNEFNALEINTISALEYTFCTHTHTPTPAHISIRFRFYSSEFSVYFCQIGFQFQQ